MKRYFLFIFVLLTSSSYGQQEEGIQHPQGNLRITTGIQHTYIRKKINGEGSGLSLPGWSLDADYWLSSRFGLGFTSDIILENYIVEEHAHEGHRKLERNFPVSLVPTAYYRPAGNLAIFGGYGLEMSKEKDLQILRTGIEYSIDLPRRWEIGVSAIYDVKLKGYNSLSLGVGLSRQFSLTRNTKQKVH